MCGFLHYNSGGCWCANKVWPRCQSGLRASQGNCVQTGKTRSNHRLLCPHQGFAMATCGYMLRFNMLQLIVPNGGAVDAAEPQRTKQAQGASAREKSKACRYAGFCEPHGLPRALDRHSSGPRVAPRLGAADPPASAEPRNSWPTWHCCAQRLPVSPAPKRLVSVALILTLYALRRFRRAAVSCCAVLCSPDVPPVRGFPPCTSGGLAGFTGRIVAQVANPCDKFRIQADNNQPPSPAAA